MTSPRRSIMLSVLAAATLVAACGGSDDTASQPDAETSAASESSETSDTVEAEPSSAGEPTGTVGDGVLRIDGVEHTGLSGDCEILRGFGTEDVGDLSIPGKAVIVAIDNVDESADFEANADAVNFVMTNESGFRVRNIERGTIDSITEIGTRTSDGSRDYVTVRFAGPLEDGGLVEADVYCELQNKF